MTSKKVKILRVVTQAEVVVWHLKNFIEQSGDDYELYILGSDVSRYSTRFPKVTFIDGHISRKISFFKDLKSLWLIYQLCVKLRPNILHSIMPKSGFLCAIAGYFARVPVRLHTFTGQVWATKVGLSRALLKWMDNLVFKLNTQCLTDSPSQTDFLIANGFYSGQKKIAHLGKGSFAGVDLERFRPIADIERKALKKQLGFDESDFIYVYLARKTVVKGIVPLFESFSKIAHLPNVKLLFIGPDESNGVLQNLFEQYDELSAKITSLDIVAEHEKYLGVSDVLCLPSSSEGFGTIVIEASAVGTPSIGFDIVGLSDAIAHDVSGYLVPLGNTEMFAEKMEHLFRSKEDYDRLRMNGIERVNRLFSAAFIYQEQKKIYEMLLTKYLAR